MYWQLKDSVARYELLLLRALRFEIYVSMPHSVRLYFIILIGEQSKPAECGNCMYVIGTALHIH